MRAVPGLRAVTGLRAKGARFSRAASAVAAAGLLLAGCSSGGSTAVGSSTSAGVSTMASMSLPPAEKSAINVSVVPAMDSAGFFVAMRQGLFRQEGLTVNYTPATSSETAIKDQVANKIDVTGGNYVSYVQAQMSHQADLEIVAEGSVMQQGSQVIFTMPDSNIKSLSDLSGHMLGVNAPGNIDYLLSKSLLQENGADKNVSFPSKPIPFPEMGQFLKAGQVSAAALPEPFASQAMQQFGAVPLADLNQGATQNFPIEGYVVTKQWARQNPNTLKRFLAALEAGQTIADGDRPTVEKAFETLNGPRSGQVTNKISSVMALDNYPIGLDPTRLQRVSNVMSQFGLESGRNKAFQVSSMLMPAGTFDFKPFESSQAASS